MLQEMCRYEWQGLIAEAARKGLSGEAELQWDSYKTLDRQLEIEWVQDVEERKNTPRPKGSKRAPKSADQRRKISEAISAKWADPEYRNRVRSSFAKFYGLEGVERKPRRKLSGERQTRKRSHTKKDETDNLVKHEMKSQAQRFRLKRSRASFYRDPFASSKLEMLKNIRAQRAAPANQKSEAISRAKLLIAKAEKAAKALEIAAKNSPHVQTSLTESRMLIAEAIQFIESIQNEENAVLSSDDLLSENSTEPLPHVEQETDPNSMDFVNHSKLNGFHIKTEDLSFNKVVLPDLNGSASNSCHDDLHKTEQELHRMSSGSLVMNLDDPEPNHNDRAESSSENAEAQKEHAKIIKKWVRGKLVEVFEEP
ncbi:hypothetical protein CDL12_06036 [Handroanthus impetiginosus]|uniref:Nuclease associated modular domain-containing protein n=1 Tax=Handroanthus impetiginosus TaxID=429701 RepID=A0A2G9HUQ0_9LAMI|nr:hypothetical protein CDL12_06036 [Handroanthus impetiginosus]